MEIRDRYYLDRPVDCQERVEPGRGGEGESSSISFLALRKILDESSVSSTLQGSKGLLVRNVFWGEERGLLQ